MGCTVNGLVSVYTSLFSIHFVSDMAILVLKRDVKLQLTPPYTANSMAFV